MASVTVRFAPSPTGLIHIGNARTALLNWLFARRHSGRFLLRFDDTDRERSREAFANAIEEDLGWLGVDPDSTARQSERFERYGAAVERLKAAGRLYPCFETADELERMRRRQLARGRPPVYDCSALQLTAQDQERLAAEGRRPHWRFRLEARSVEWTDLIRGPQRFEGGSLSDPILVREDASYLYTLPSVVDDIDFAVSHVIRGEDHVTNTAVQIELFEALGAPSPQFAHHSLLIGADGRRISKRLGALSIGALREQGLEPMAVVSLAATIGTSETIAPHADLAELVQTFDLARLSRAPARFDEAELRSLNARLLRQLPYTAVRDRLAAMGVVAGEAFWLAVRGNLATLADAETWYRVVRGPIDPRIEDADLCRTAAELLPAEPWDGATWKAWTEALKMRTGRKGKALFHPLRLALTARDTGPELAALLPLIGRQKAGARLAGGAA